MESERKRLWNVWVMSNGDGMLSLSSTRLSDERNEQEWERVSSGRRNKSANVTYTNYTPAYVANYFLDLKYSCLKLYVVSHY